jgi:hypothetical protein
MADLTESQWTLLQAIYDKIKMLKLDISETIGRSQIVEQIKSSGKLYDFNHDGEDFQNLLEKGLICITLSHGQPGNIIPDDIGITLDGYGYVEMRRNKEQ